MTTWRRRARRELDLLSAARSGPEYDFGTERIFRRWRRCVLTTSDVERFTEAFVRAAVEASYSVPDMEMRLSAVVRAENVDVHLQELGKLRPHLEALDPPDAIQEIRLSVSPDLQLLALLVFQRRRPGVWLAVQGLVDPVPGYGNLAQDMARSIARALRPFTTSSLWTYAVPRVVAPGLQLSVPGESVSFFERPPGRALKWVAGAIGAALIAALIRLLIG